MNVDDFLLRRMNEPAAWFKVFGITGLLAGGAAGFAQGGVKAAILGAIVGGFIGGVAGLRFRVIARIVGWFVGILAARLDGQVRRPEQWGRPMVCLGCGWRTTPDGPWTRVDCAKGGLSKRCPSCELTLVLLPPPPCPKCGADERRQSGRPALWLWGGSCCSKCGTDYDKWGRLVTRPHSEAIPPRDR